MRVSFRKKTSYKQNQYIYCELAFQNMVLSHPHQPAYKNVTNWACYCKGKLASLCVQTLSPQKKGFFLLAYLISAHLHLTITLV